mmetsp:Transcript_57320/g.64024  ORF Transcript_57320/g.64024 Transcript_57320/m.64024 type:complete len:91 (+) Transcript_57320:1567-1839(+)
MSLVAVNNIISTFTVSKSILSRGSDRLSYIYSIPRTFLTSSFDLILFLMGKKGPSSPFFRTSVFGPNPHSEHSETHFTVSTVTPMTGANS